LTTGAQDTILPHIPWMVSGMPKSMWQWAVPAANRFAEPRYLMENGK
jgi:hypothetical protein